MTDRKTPAEDPEIIEGVAVEKQDSATGSDTTGSGARSRRQSARKKTGGTSDRKAGSKDQAQQKTGEDPRRAGGGMALFGLLAATAILMAAGGVLFQEWRAAARQDVLATELGQLAARVEMAEAGAGDARDEAARLAGDLAARLTALESALPDNPGAALGGLADAQADLAAAQVDLAAAQGDLATRLARLESAPAARRDAAASPDLTLALSGLTVASAMLADSLAGADAGRWLPVLDDLGAAGLPLDGLASLRAALSPAPPSASRVLAAASDLVPMLRETARDQAGGWWTSTTDMLAGFVTLRRRDQAGAEPGPDAVSPLASFEDAVARRQIRAAFEASAALADLLPEREADIAAWRAAAERRLAADEALAAFSAEMAAFLAGLGDGGRAR